MLKVNSSSTGRGSDRRSRPFQISVVDTQGGIEADVEVGIGKARMAFLQLKNIWNFNVLSLKNKIRIFNTNVNAVLLYGARDMKDHSDYSKEDTDLCQHCLRGIVGVWLTEITSNEQL